MASRRGTHLVLAAVVIAFVAALVAAAAFLTGSDGQAQAPPPRPAAAANPALVPLPESAAVPTTNGMTAALAAAVADPNLGNLTGRITDAQTGQQIWEQRADVPMQPASTNKLLTTAAALLTLDRNARVATTVRAADQTRMPGTVVLVGGGDPTLSAAPPGVQTWYHGPDLRSRRSGAQERGDGDGRPGRHLAVHRPGYGAGLGPRGHRRR